tara:strand:+ start:2662 stop:3135 length:474 start_codon:yes stop_codon:yes gene_type:complete
MIKKLTIFIFIIFGLTNCGYSPMYSDNNDMNFEIYEYELEGDTEVNNAIENKLKKYLNNNSKTKYIIKLESNYEKISATKDRTGSTTHFKLVVNLKLIYEKIGSEQKKAKKEASFSESLIIKKNTDNFEQNDYERITIKNISELLFNKVILYLARSS